MKTLLFFLSFISVLAKSEKVNCKSKEKAKEDIRTKLVHLLELEPFREFFSEVPHFFMSTIKYKNAIKESPKVGEEKVEDEKPTLKALTQNVTLDECGCTKKSNLPSQCLEINQKSLILHNFERSELWSFQLRKFSCLFTYMMLFSAVCLHL